MGEVWGWLLLVGQVAVPVAALGTVLFFLARFLGPRPRDARGSPAVAPDGRGDPDERRGARRAALAIGVSGFCLPWVVGLAVKVWLDAHGEPTYPLSSFLSPTAVVILVLATVGQWCWPFLLLAWWVGSRHFPRFAPGRTFGERLLLARLTHLVGLAGGVAVFLPVFRVWDTLYIFVPLGVVLVLPMAAGYGVGRLVLRRRDAKIRSTR